ncbi:MAG: hypothetical protein ACRCSZ_04030 [Lactococcus lactis]
MSICYSESAANFALGADAAQSAGVCFNDAGMIINSDRSQASFSLLQRVLPKSRLRNCEEHIIRNISNDVKDLNEEVISIVRNCFRAKFERHFKEYLGLLQIKNQKAFDYLSKINVRHYATYTYIEDKLRTYSETNNNPAESEAARLLSVRKMSTELEMIVGYLDIFSNCIVTRQEELRSAGHFLNSKADEIIQNNILRCRSYSAVVCDANYQIYKVYYGNPGTNLEFKVVDLRKKTWTCGFWQDLGVPCVHPWACIPLAKVSNQYVFENWVDVSYRVSSQQTAFETSLRMSDVSLLATASEVAGTGSAGSATRQPGRPKSNSRIASVGEKELKKAKKTKSE